MDTVNIMNETFGSTRRQDYSAEEVFLWILGEVLAPSAALTICAVSGPTCFIIIQI